MTERKRKYNQLDSETSWMNYNSKTCRSKLIKKSDNCDNSLFVMKI